MGSQNQLEGCGVKYRWADGFHAPKGVEVDQVAEAIQALPQPTPAALLSASKRKRHCLHNELWAEGDQVWAQRARLDRCRKIIASIEEVVFVGGKSLSVRSVEFVRTASDPKGAWHHVGDIMQNRELLDAYFAETERALEQAQAKVARVRALLEVGG